MAETIVIFISKDGTNAQYPSCYAKNPRSPSVKNPPLSFSVEYLIFVKISKTFQIS